MNKKELLSYLSYELDISKDKACETLNVFVMLLQQSMLEGNAIALPGLGSFTAKIRAERKCRNPATGKEMIVPATRVPVFKPSAELKRMVNEGKTTKE